MTVHLTAHRVLMRPKHESGMRETLLTFIGDFAAKPSDPAFAHKTGLRTSRWARGEVAANVYRFARELEVRGVGKGDRVLVWAGNSPEWVVAFLGCLLRGAIVVPLDVQSAAPFAERVRQQTSPKLLLHSGDTPANFAADLARLNLERLRETIAHHSGEPYAAVDIGQDDIAEIIYTSGTTTEPKGVCLTHRNLLANLNPLERGMQKYLGYLWLVHPLRFLSLVPLSHVLGQFMGLFVPQLLRGEVVFHDSLSPSEIAETVRCNHVSVVVTVPRLLNTLREKVERDDEAKGGLRKFQKKFEQMRGKHFLKKWWAFRDVHRRFGWKFWAFVSGGAPLDQETEEFWHRLGYLTVQGYGMTETASLISFNDPFKTTRGSLGKSFASQEVRLDESGEILVRGGNVSPGYWQGGLRPLTDEEGWLRTGDLGERDSEGKLYFKGRKKDVIVTAAGLNIYPEDLEAELDRQAGVRESVVVGVEGRRGAEPVAVLLLDRGADAEAVVRGANQRLGDYQQVRRWFVWPGADFPRTTTTKKVRKRDILETVVKAGGSNGPLDQRTALAESSPRPGGVGELAETVARLSGEPPGGLDAAANLTTDLKLDSLGRVELLGAIEDRFQVELDEAQFTQATTLGDIERMIQQAQPRASNAGAALLAELPRQYPFAEWAFRSPVTWLRLVVLYIVILPAGRLFGRARVRGAENLQGVDEPVLFVANHIAQLDAGLILSAAPNRFKRRFAVAMQGERLRGFRHPSAGLSRFRRLVARVKYVLVVTFFNVFPLPHESGFRKSFDFAGKLADRGYNLLVFPEGKRTEDGRMSPFKRGTGLLVEGLNVTVVPVKIDGLFELKKRGRRFALPGEIAVTFGEPVRYAPGTDADFITRDLEQRVRELGSPRQQKPV
jgi:long-chain acyl-CoA synthetase